MSVSVKNDQEIGVTKPLRDLEQDVRLLFRELWGGKISKNDICAAAGFQRAKMRKVLDIGDRETKEKEKGSDRLPISSVIGLIDLAVSRKVDIDPDFSTRSSNQFKKIKRKLEILGSIEGQLAGERGGLERDSKIHPSMLPGNRLTDVEYKKISGLYLAFRRMPASDRVLVSGIKIWRERASDQVRWKNNHPIATKFSLPYEGVIRSNSSHISMIGMRNDKSFLNILGIRMPVQRLGYLHGIAFLETDDQPTLSRLFLLRQESASSLDELSDSCRSMTVKEAVDIGLVDEAYIDMLPYTGDGKNFFNNKQAILPRSYNE